MKLKKSLFIASIFRTNDIFFAQHDDNFIESPFSINLESFCQTSSDKEEKLLREFSTAQLEDIFVTSRKHPKSLKAFTSRYHGVLINFTASHPCNGVFARNVLHLVETRANFEVKCGTKQTCNKFQGKLKMIIKILLQ